VEVVEGSLEGAIRILRIRTASVLFHERRRQYFVSRSERRRRAMRRARKRLTSRRST